MVIESFKTVNIVYDPRTGLRVAPFEVELELGQTLLWNVSTGSDYEIEVDFHVKGNQKGPFPPVPGERRGRYIRQGEGRIETRMPDDLGYWEYDVIVRTTIDNAITDVAAVDPGVMVKPGGGGG